MARTAQENPTTTATRTLFVALELSKNTWKLALTTGRTEKARIRDVVARDLSGLAREIEGAKRRFGLAADAPVVTCYEAGRDGFWIHRFLEAQGIRNLVVDPASIQVDRRLRHVKTDRLDAQNLAHLLARHHDGEAVLRVARVPPADVEDERLLPRMRKTFQRKRAQASSQIQAALIAHGIDLSPRDGAFEEAEFLGKLEKVRQWDGSELPPELVRYVRALWDHYALATRQIKELEQRQRRALNEARRGSPTATEAQQKAARLTELRGVGDTGAYLLCTEFFGWRGFDNRRQLGALAGLTGTPFQSGDVMRDQGISKSGNPRVRTLMVELAWLWIRWQPDSKVTHWFHQQVGRSGKRSKRKAIVAVARKLLVEFWHFIEHGVVPEGAILKETA